MDWRFFGERRGLLRRRRGQLSVVFHFFGNFFSCHHLFVVFNFKLYPSSSSLHFAIFFLHQFQIPSTKPAIPPALCPSFPASTFMLLLVVLAFSPSASRLEGMREQMAAIGLSIPTFVCRRWTIRSPVPIGKWDGRFIWWPSGCAAGKDGRRLEGMALRGPAATPSML